MGTLVRLYYVIHRRQLGFKSFFPSIFSSIYKVTGYVSIPGPKILTVYDRTSSPGVVIDQQFALCGTDPRPSSSYEISLPDYSTLSQLVPYPLSFAFAGIVPSYF